MSNPQFTRFRRAEFHIPRLLIAGSLTLILCFLLRGVHAEFLSGRYTAPGAALQQGVYFSDTLFYAFLGLQWILLPLWCLTACLHAVTVERQTKTFDFVRTTRLSPAELMVGYLFGAPLLGYFTIGISVIVSIVVGIREGIPSEVIAINYAQLIVLSLIAGLIGLAVSTLIEKSWIVGGLPCCWFLRSGAACSTTPLKERLSRDSWHSHPSASRRGFTPVFLSSALICRFTPLRSFSI